MKHKKNSQPLEQLALTQIQTFKCACQEKKNSYIACHNPKLQQFRTIDWTFWNWKHINVLCLGMVVVARQCGHVRVEAELRSRGWDWAGSVSVVVAWCWNYYGDLGHWRAFRCIWLGLADPMDFSTRVISIIVMSSTCMFIFAAQVFHILYWYFIYCVSYDHVSVYIHTHVCKFCSDLTRNAPWQLVMSHLSRYISALVSPPACTSAQNSCLTSNSASSEEYNLFVRCTLCAG